MLPVQVTVAAPGVVKSPMPAQVKIDIKLGTRVVKSLAAQTDRNGSLRARWKITDAIPTGTMSASADASIMLLDGFDCTGGLVYATGEGAVDPLTKVRR